MHTVNSVTLNDYLLPSKLNDVSSVIEGNLVDWNVNFLCSILESTQKWKEKREEILEPEDRKSVV